MKYTKSDAVIWVLLIFLVTVLSWYLPTTKDQYRGTCIGCGHSFTLQNYGLPLTSRTVTNYGEDFRSYIPPFEVVHKIQVEVKVSGAVLNFLFWLSLFSGVFYLNNRYNHARHRH